MCVAQKTTGDEPFDTTKHEFNINILFYKCIKDSNRSIPAPYMLYDSTKLPVRVISLSDSKFRDAKRHIDAAAVFPDVKRWNAIRGSVLFDDASCLLADYSEILAEKYPAATFPLSKTSHLLSTQAEITLSTGVRTNIYDLHNPGAVGCSLSHISLWQHMIDNQIPVMLVFEDDVVFEDAFIVGQRNCNAELDAFFASFGLNFDVFNLNICTIPQMFVHGTVLTPSSALNTVSYLQGVAFRTQGYVITLRGAKKLLANAFPLLHAVDSFMTMPTIIPTMKEDFVYLAAYPVWLRHPGTDFTGSDIKYGFLQTIVDSTLFLPRPVILALFGLCLLFVITTIVCLTLYFTVLHTLNGRQSQRVASTATPKTQSEPRASIRAVRNGT